MEAVAVAVCVVIAASMSSKAGAMHVFKKKVDNLCKRYEHVRQLRHAECERLLNIYRSEMQCCHEDVLHQASQFRTKHQLQTPARNWEQPGAVDPLAEQAAEVDSMCLALQLCSSNIRAEVVAKFQEALSQRFRGEVVQTDSPPVDEETNALHAREVELLGQVKDYYCCVLEADEDKFDELLQFYEEVTVRQAEKVTMPLLQEVQTL